MLVLKAYYHLQLIIKQKAQTYLILKHIKIILLAVVKKYEKLCWCVDEKYRKPYTSYFGKDPILSTILLLTWCMRVFIIVEY